MFDMDILNENSDFVVDTIDSGATSNDNIDVSKLPLDVILGDQYEEYTSIKQANDEQQKKIEELKSTILRVEAEIKEMKNKLLDEAKEESEKLKQEADSLESQLQSLLGNSSSSEEII